MEVKPDYKQTKVGVIPEDWEVKLLPDVCRFRGGKAHEQHVSDLGRFVCVNSKFISTNGNVRKYSTANFCCAKCNDILLVMSDLPNGRALAKAFLVDQDNLYAVNQRVCALSPYRDCSKYLFYILNRNPYFLKFDDGVNQTHLLNNVFRACPLALPPTKAEQTAIAEALSDADALIESLEQLIAKKRHLKQGAMQELLTGKKRLPGFEVKPGYKQTEVGIIPEDWDLDYIENLSHITTGGRNTQDRVNDGQYPFFVRSQTVERINSYSFEGEAVLTAGDGVGTGKVFHYINGKFDVHQRVYRISDFSEQINGYFFYLYFSSHFYGRIMQMTAKSSVDSVRREMIAKMLIPLPPTKAEQETIATILSDMDAEIAALEGKLAKARYLKQGMMQELLTGRIRLIN